MLLGKEFCVEMGGLWRRWIEVDFVEQPDGGSRFCRCGLLPGGLMND